MSETSVAEIREIHQEPQRNHVEMEKTDKGESITTNNYFERWEDVKLEGNPELKEQIRQNILKAESINQQTYERAAADLGVSVEEFKARLQKKVEEMVEKSNFFVATPPGVLEQIMRGDGRWRSQFETNNSEGILNPELRAKAEASLFGFNSRLDTQEDILQNNKERRPIYGYFSDDEHGAQNQLRRDGPSFTDRYGSIKVKVKKERALQKATLSFQDSLTLARKTIMPPTPAAKPHFTSFDRQGLSRTKLHELNSTSIINWGAFNTEAEYHGGLTMDDVEAIYVSKDTTPEDIEKIRGSFETHKEQHPESTIQLIEL